MAKRKSTIRKKKTSSSRWWLWMVLLVAVVAVVFGYCWIKKQQEIHIAERAFYKAFGIMMPKGFTIHGIDVSTHQNTIAWKKVKAMQVSGIKMSFAILKATEGVINTDKRYKINQQQAQEAGLITGAYHFFIPTKSGLLQARNFIAHANLGAGSLPPVVDIEQLYSVSPATMRKRLQECLDELENFYKVKPIIYTNVDFYDKYLGKNFDDYPLWVAHYLEPVMPRIQRDWLFWQHSEKGHVNGITTFVDCNVFNGDSTDLQKILLH